ncbi:NIPSNAP family protein [Pedobacter cryophilus]|uniref:NIPSNAP family containing protein n=1 Tax=Pedobacter cryophilus TaxID=2571271 RepID=A0A4U1C528_9SPHI|nr:NIPSNAP family protein [Pedobacter cryophilus]TKC00513.1 NIPSNAP family containing protein [Pedobacter cryophilus]
MNKQRLNRLKICLVALAFIFGFLNPLKAQLNKAELIQIIIYHCSTDSQVLKTERYLEQAFLLALHQSKINRVGVFKPLDFEKDKRIMVIIPYQSFKHFTKISALIKQDKQHLQNGKAYLNAAYNASPYDRMETIFLNSFFKEPVLKKPNLSGSIKDKIYELRSYESATELLHQKKVKMFNEGGETEIFSRLNFNPVFYGSVISGSKMPNLMYLTSFENMDDRKAHWAAFSADNAWKKLSALPEYKNTVSKNETTFLRSTSYSDL